MTAKTATKTAMIPTMAVLTDGSPILTGLPFMIDGLREDGAAGRSRMLMGSAGFRWTYDKLNNGWVRTATSTGTVADVITALAGYDVEVLDLTGAAVKPATRKAAAKPAPAPTEPVTGATLAESITAALVADGVDPAIIAAAVAAAVAAANGLAKTATASALAKPAPTRKGAAKPAPAAAKPAARKVTAGSVAATSDGERVLTLADGAPLAATAKAVRQALSRAKITGVSVRKDGRTLVAYNHNGAPVSASIDAVMVAAAASVA